MRAWITRHPVLSLLGGLALAGVVIAVVYRRLHPADAVETTTVVAPGGVAGAHRRPTRGAHHGAAARFPL